MDKRFKLWLAISLGVFLINGLISSILFPPKPKPVAQKPADDTVKPGNEAAKPNEAKPAEPAAAEKPDDVAVEEQPAAVEKPVEGEPAEAVAEKPVTEEVPPQWISLGSGDPASPYRMLVTLTNIGAAVERVELNSPKYHELEDRSGYLGHLAVADVPKLGGAKVRAVGDGTPAKAAGVQVDDVIIELQGKPVTSGQKLDELLEATEPGNIVKLTVERAGEKVALTATLRRRPLEVVRPERASKQLDVLVAGKHDPLSMLFTLQTLDDKSLEAPKDGGPGKELPGINLWNGTWDVDNLQADEVTFRKVLPNDGLELVKTFKLAKAKGNAGADDPLYHLTVEVGIRNTGSKARTVAYQLDGPNGLPIEGAWYANKVSRNWGAGGLRDVVVRFNGANVPTEVGCKQIVDNKFTAWVDTPLNYIAVDAQYFAAALIPQKQRAEDIWFTDVRPLLVGEVPKDVADQKLTNISFRLTSRPQSLEPNGKAFVHEYRFFAGPKRPAILEEYTAMPPMVDNPVSLDDLVYYGWFGWVAKPMLAVLHFFYRVFYNYGIAIVMLTVLVRGAMFPVSRKQALSAQKMQELQPKIKELTEKYKSNPQERQKAQMELFRKHNYNPLSGCLPMFIQLPIFVGLYRSLMVDVELRDAPLISQAVRWASNLAAPDMLYNWSHWMPAFVNSGQGIFGLGPYLNVFPLVTIALFLWQQKLFMPPATDEQTAMQQKMMKYMMIFMGFMFFKVASGLCLYFIASSLWGITERKLLPKTLPQTQNKELQKKSESFAGNGSTGKNKKKQRS